MDNSKQLPRDVFMHLLVLVTLVVVSVNLGTLLFQFVNIGVPDIVVDQYRMPLESYKNAIRWSVASLVIVFPVFVWAMRFLKRDIIENPEKSNMKIRRWILYLLLFSAGGVLIGDLVALVYGFLEGELTTRFVLKVAVILAIAGSVFVFFLNELRDRIRPYTIFSWSVIVLVFAAMVGGVIVAGLPQSRRLARLDERRSSDLSNIYSSILSYWQAKSRLPKDASEIQSADIYGNWQMPVDPVTGEPYEYRVINARTFELCAVFQTEGDSSQAVVVPKPVPEGVEPGDVVYSAGDFFQHGIGKVCFERKIDPDFLKR